MSPASRSKSKDQKAGKEPQKSSAKPVGPANSGIPTGAYNPILGTFHSLETAPTSSASSLHINGRFRNIVETDEHCDGLLGVGVEYDSVSNNGSWSGESEDHKEKIPNPPVRLETVPGAADSDKRERIRQKNEKKHQRQKERRAQELHERCSGYLMSRKLEALAQQLVAMGFSQERATMALILNEGRVEESVAWLFEGGEEAKHRDQNIAGANMEINISEELARIADMGIRYKCSKQEVERAVVACEGDLEKAAETLRVLRQDPPSPLPRPDETCDPPTVSNGKLSVAVSQNMVRQQPKPTMSSTILKRGDEKDFNYTKAAVTVGGSLESVTKNVQPLEKTQPKLERAKAQQTAMPADKRWPSMGSNPSISYSLTSPLKVSPPPAKTETRFVSVVCEIKNLQSGTVREPVVMMQRPQSVNTKQVPATSISSSSPGTVASWYPTNSVEIMKSNGMLPDISSTRSLSSNQIYNQLHYQQQENFDPSSSHGHSPGTSQANGSWSRTGASPILAAASSLGLFSGLGSTGTSGASSPVDWSNGGSMMYLDYTNIDWSLDRGLPSPRPSGLSLGLVSFMENNGHIYDSNAASGVGAKPAMMRSAPHNGNGDNIVGLQDGGTASV